VSIKHTEEVEKTRRSRSPSTPSSGVLSCRPRPTSSIRKTIRDTQGVERPAARHLDRQDNSRQSKQSKQSRKRSKRL